MKIAIVTSAHSAFDVRIFHKQAVSLAQAGHDVVIVVPHAESEARDGIRILATRKRNRRLARFTLSTWDVFRRTLSERPDVVHFHDPELLPFALLLRACGVKVVYDVHENIAGSILTKRWIPAWMRRPVSELIGAFEHGVSRRMTAIVAATPAIARQFDHSLTVVVENHPRIEELVTTSKRAYVDREPLVIYAGVISALRGAGEMVRSAARVASTGCRLLLLGPIRPEELGRELKAMDGWNATEYLGQVSREVLVRELDRARVGLVLFHPAPNHADSQPNKIFEYMAAGIPVVVSDFPGWRILVEGVGCGICVDPFDTDAIAGAIRWLLANPAEAEEMGTRGREAVLQRYNWGSQAVILNDLYRQLGVNR